MDTSANASRYAEMGTVGATELQCYINVTSAQPEVRRPEIGISTIAGINVQSVVSINFDLWDFQNISSTSMTCF